LNLAAIAHKYHFTSFQTWAIDVVAFHCEGGNFYTRTCSSAILERTIQIATLYGRPAICRAVEQDWLKRLYYAPSRVRYISTEPQPLKMEPEPEQGPDLDPDPEPVTSTVGHTLDVSEKYGLRSFARDIYHKQIKSMHTSGGASNPVSVAFDPSLSLMQKYRVLFGYCSLSLYSDSSHFLQREPSGGCSQANHRQLCRPAWRKAWEYSVSFRTSDRLGILEAFQEELDRLYTSNQACKAALIADVEQRISEIQKFLLDLTEAE